MNTAEAIKSAREALDSLISTGEREHTPTFSQLEKGRQALSALMQLSTAEQPQPVAWMWQHEETGNIGFIEDMDEENLAMWKKLNRRLKLIKPLYSAPQASQPVALTDEQKDAIYNAWRAKGDSVSYGDLIDDVERALLSATSQPSEAEIRAKALEDAKQVAAEMLDDCTVSQYATSKECLAARAMAEKIEDALSALAQSQEQQAPAVQTVKCRAVGGTCNCSNADAITCPGPTNPAPAQSRYCNTCERDVTEPCSSVDCSTPEFAPAQTGEK